MTLFTLSVPVQVVPPRGTLPLPMTALIGRSREVDGRVEVTADAGIPTPGGILFFRLPAVITLAPSVVAATQEIELPPRTQD